MKWLLLLVLSGCTLYENEGRKFFESNAESARNITPVSLTALQAGCATLPDSSLEKAQNREGDTLLETDSSVLETQFVKKRCEVMVDQPQVQSALAICLVYPNQIVCNVKDERLIDHLEEHFSKSAQGTEL